MSRPLMVSVLSALILFILLSLSFVYVFPPETWAELWDKTVMGVPFLLFVSVVSLLIGIASGLVLDFVWRKQRQVVMQALEQIEHGEMGELWREEPSPELQDLWRQIEKLQTQWLEQTKRVQKLAAEKVEQEERLVERILSEERTRLARELHDSVSQQLFAASMMMSAITETMPPDDERQRKQLKMVEQMIHQSQLEMRALLLHLRPVQLKGKSLQEGMEELLTELTGKVPLEMKWKIEDVPLDKGVEDHLFRILQESLSNTLRHAKAKTVEVLLIERDGFAILRVTDDGVGFDVERSKSGSYGLQHMYERAAEIGGTLKVVSLKGQGTRLEVKVPLVYKGG
ncbi:MULTISPECIES: sensor histidine kinase [Geobacillus]|jgi:two-component system, NarL family, sensor histidine kinase LiaS|uniref:Sensor histidine kinase n=2 Tax=Geobacillus thermodenitrificans TaxID=33940 RepID=A4IKG9_GEOTN|nr:MULTISPECIES: sensor histidine kinase [Geobacillus]ABO65823.1 Two-component sensor histidine kinase [Geobacillus thermodenitrificans NG80-2]ARA97735.1 two-component sensor histidine kinase [Geobacillus thermodenitrificans]ARP41532.1 Sensor protein VraS [Geobacillus thermodenitrificans]ATO37071.1 two-component sensor histidine kinase [Geobacillus thermodenitrificans]KQB94558.1 histidine kinase [Geobacillus sp. PA-3]